MSTTKFLYSCFSMLSVLVVHTLQIIDPRDNVNNMVVKTALPNVVLGHRKK